MSSRLFRMSPLKRFTAATLLAMLASVGLYGYEVLQTHSLAYSYLLWNLFLAALPLVFAIRLVATLMRKRWSDWEPIAWSLLWVIFLPNSFYMISDYIHLRMVPADRILYVAVLFSSFIFLGLTFGMSSLYVVHRALWRRLRGWRAGVVVALLLLLCSFAIYIGRDLRWNSWDVIINPAGLLFDVTDRVLRPEAYPTMFITVASFFVMLSGIYIVFWTGLNILHPPRRKH